VGTPLGFNNPVRQVLEESCSLFGDKKNVSFILSLRSGKPAVLSLDWQARSSDSLHNLLTHVVLDCERVEREFAYRLGQCKSYLRLNVDQGVEGIKIHDWDKLGAISQHTDVYLSRGIGCSIDTYSRFLKERNGTLLLGELSRCHRSEISKC